MQLEMKRRADMQLPLLLRWYRSFLLGNLAHSECSGGRVVEETTDELIGRSPFQLYVVAEHEVKPGGGIVKVEHAIQGANKAELWPLKTR